MSTLAALNLPSTPTGTDYLLGAALLHHILEIRQQLHHQLELVASPSDRITLELLIKDVEVVQDYGLRTHLLATKPAIAPEVVVFTPMTVPSPESTVAVLDKVDSANDRRRRRSVVESPQTPSEVKAIQDGVAAAVYPLVFAAANNDYELLLGYSLGYLQRVVASGDGVAIRDILAEKLVKVLKYIARDATPDLSPLRAAFKKYLEVAISVKQTTPHPDPRHLRERGNNQMTVLAYAAAIQLYTEAIAGISTDTFRMLPQLYTNRAIAHIGLNCFHEAIKDLNIACALDWLFVPSWTQLGYCHLYLGLAVVALRLYLCALRATVGELIPESLFGADLDKVAIYEQLRMAAVMPQFVQRLVTAISLSERRANQQGENLDTVKVLVLDVRRILARLRAGADNDDERQRCYTYTRLMRTGLFNGPATAAAPEREAADSSNRRRPQILTGDVLQDVLLDTVGLDQTLLLPFERIVRRPQELTTLTSTATATAAPQVPSRAARAAALMAALAAAQVLGSGFSRDYRDRDGPILAGPGEQRSENYIRVYGSPGERRRRLVVPPLTVTTPAPAADASATMLSPTGVASVREESVADPVSAPAPAPTTLTLTALSAEYFPRRERLLMNVLNDVGEFVLEIRPADQNSPMFGEMIRGVLSNSLRLFAGSRLPSTEPEPNIDLEDDLD